MVKAIFEEGRDFTFGDANERKEARGIFGVVQVYGNGIQDILKCKAPKGFLWDGKKISSFLENSVKEVCELRNGSHTKKFEYTYPELLVQYPDAPVHCRDQLTTSMLRLAVDRDGSINSNRNVGVLYNPIFWNEKDVPCFNWYQIKYMGNDKISVRLLFRSHDWGSAVWANLSMILGLINNEMSRWGNKIEIEEVICTSACAHIYHNDRDSIERRLDVSWRRFIPRWWVPNKRLE